MCASLAWGPLTNHRCRDPSHLRRLPPPRLLSFLTRRPRSGAPETPRERAEGRWALLLLGLAGAIFVESNVYARYRFGVCPAVYEDHIHIESLFDARVPHTRRSILEQEVTLCPNDSGAPALINHPDFLIFRSCWPHHQRRRTTGSIVLFVQKLSDLILKAICWYKSLIERHVTLPPIILRNV